MEDNLIHERYRQLACASILQAVEDFLKDKHSDEHIFYTWCNNCSYFDYLGLDREYFYVKVLKMKEKGIKKVRKFTYGKKEIEQAIK